MARHTLDGCREVFGRDIQALGLEAHIALRPADARGKQGHELLHDIGRAVSMRFGRFVLGMRLKNVVHHRQTKTAHQLTMELQMALTHTVAQTMEIIKQVPGLLVGEFDDRILIQRDAASDAVVIRWQQVLQELIVGGKPFHLHVGMGCQILHPVGHGNHHQVVPSDMIAMFVEHKTPLPRLAKQMHASVAQLSGIHPVKVGGIMEISFHIVVFGCEDKQYFP